MSRSGPLTDDLREILSLVRGERYAGISASIGLTSFPLDPEGGGLHKALLELERHGAVRRIRETDQYVQWVAVKGWVEPR